MVWAAQKKPPAKPRAPVARIRSDGFTGHEGCGSCHQDIHKAWSESAHARAVSDPAFRAGVEESVTKHGEDSKRLCLTCHAPTTFVTHATNLQDPLVREGITCDFCHSVKSVDLSRTDNPFEIVVGPVKYGPFEYAPSPAHQTALSVLHRNKPTLCAGCHEYKTVGGFPALTTYSEWTQGPYPALGVSCQDCHMALVQGSTARKDVKIREEGSYRFINLHRLVGGGSLGQLRRGVDLEVLTAEARGDSGIVEVEIVNSAAGHKVPTGLPSKQLVLTVKALAGGKETFSESRVYQRKVVDEKGQPIRSDGDLFMAASREEADNRIAPKEKRRETFRFPISAGTMQAEITLTYRYSPPGPEAPRVLVLARELKELRRR
jgi:Cytochrome c554 and c-prime